jgi:regulator of sigma E protease
MHAELTGVCESLAFSTVLGDWVASGYQLLKILIGFSIIIFIHELGHFLACKWMDVRVNRFAVGFFYRLCGYRRGEGLTFGPRPSYTAEEIAAKGYGETDYCLNALPFGGYVKMLGENDLDINEQTGEIKTSADPRAFTNKSIGRRMVVVSAGVVFNVLFAVLVFGLVFMSGLEVDAPVIGAVAPGAPEADAGLQAGDRITAVNGRSVASWEAAFTAMLLADGPVRVRVARPGEPAETELVVQATARGERLGAGLRPMFTTTYRSDLKVPPDESGPQPGDKVTHVNGEPVSGGLEIMAAFKRSHGQPVELTAERPDRAHGGAVERVKYALQPSLAIAPSASLASGDPTGRDTTDLLGFRRRQRVFAVPKGAPAAQAGFQAGDIIAQWDSVGSPRYAEITGNINAHENQAITVVVERAGQPVTLHVTPKREFKLYGNAPVRVGIEFGVIVGEDAKPVVADVASGSPGAALVMPRGAELTAVGGRAVRNWSEVHEALRAAAGTTVEVRYRSGNDELSGRMAVPSSLVNELDLSPGAAILAIDGEDRAATSEKTTARLWASALAVRKLLEQKIGQTVSVEYAPDPGSTRRATKLFTVRSDNVDPWQLRCDYICEDSERLGFAALKTAISANGSPVRALVMGAEETGDSVAGMYRIVRAIVVGMFGHKPSMGVVQNIAGPIGIVQMAFQRESWPALLHFLALLSVNLAVINFLPMPVVDGGLMVFLLLEKVRGKALGLRIQVGITLAGLAIIVLCFLFVTFNDIARWMSGGL